APPRTDTPRGTSPPRGGGAVAARRSTSVRRSWMLLLTLRRPRPDCIMVAPLGQGGKAMLLPHATFIKLCRARDLLRDCFGEPIVLADAAAEAEMSAWHFLRLFRRAFGETPHQFLTRLRIDRAKDLLTVSGRSVTDICFDVGFSSLG